MADRNIGRSSGYFAIGKVMDVNDPYQQGAVRVQWFTGSAAQDQLSKEDLPWTKSLFPSHNPSLGQVGGPHTGLRVGSTVVGFPLGGDGQDYMILGTSVAGSNASSTQVDGSVSPDSDIPQAAKQQQSDDVTQPRYGDVNNVALDSDNQVVSESITKYAQDRAGPDKKAADYATLTDPIGPLAKIA